jgi:membrane-anchored protein YejM (alkaline phosphatase superfamily)
MFKNRIVRRRLLCRYVGWFTLANAILFDLIWLNLLVMMTYPSAHLPGHWRDTAAIAVYMLFTYCGQFALLAGLCALPVLLVTLLLPRRWLTIGLAVLIFSFAAFYLVLDSFSYHLFHFHTAGVVWQVVSSGAFAQVFDLSWLEYALVLTIFLLLIALQVALAFWVWRWKVVHAPSKVGRYVTLSLAACLFISYSSFFGAVAAHGPKKVDAISAHLITVNAQVVPFYIPILSALISPTGHARQLQTIGSGLFLQAAQVTHPLNYPLAPLQCQHKKAPMNVLILAVDTLRADMVNPKVMPAVSAFAKKSWDFKQHFSGGNSTRAGIFSFFYGLPGTYWTAMLEQHKGPVLMDELQRQGYQIGVFQSATLRFPAFRKTVFVDLHKQPKDSTGDNVYLRDQQIVQRFDKFLQKRDKKKPFFGYLFFDAVHSFCLQRPKYFERPFMPETQLCRRFDLNQKSDRTPFFNRYRNSAHFDDGLIAEVLQQLKAKDLLKNTLVIVTADHGASFNDHKNGYWGHASGFVNAQVQVPFIMHWPNAKAKVITHRTSHFDVAPYLLNEVLGCTGPVANYSVGQPLLKPGKRPYFIVGGYLDYAVVAPKRFTVIYPQGSYAIKTRYGFNIPQATLDFPMLRAAYHDMNRYFHNDRMMEKGSD